MFKHLRNNFTQAFGGTLIWLIILITVFITPKNITLIFLWRLIGIALILAIIFGVIYTYLWEYSIFKASTNIIISTVINVLAGFGSVYLFSSEMFSRLIAYTPYILVTTLIGHIVGFYLYSKFSNKKLAKDINMKLEMKK
ncbi:hypothetical protein ACWN8V_01925 [Vagococcus elongatus]|uniref:DUF3021 domain-containing protein n=1 Tax=Vagococcus elongatus TaxID=180344 RepID=A0A430B4E5_9ENTE|nr:hypothetical protein [Vagococcus elongatus]RSU15195.1 hypothetical protein CBF29_02350 [Vagococcus elongatus]